MDYKDLQSQKLEHQLSQLNSLASFVYDDLRKSAEALADAQIRFEKIQQEIEQIYITMDEPLAINGKKAKLEESE